MIPSRVFSLPASYRAHVEAAIAIAMAEIGRDVACRDDDDERVRQLAPVDDARYDATAPGRVYVLVVPEPDLSPQTSTPTTPPHSASAHPSVITVPQHEGSV